jgi:hypothetical protein
MLELGANRRPAREAAGQGDVVEEFEVREGGQPSHGSQRRDGRRGAGLKEWQAYMAEQAAMFRGVVMLVLGKQSRGLGEQHHGEQQQYGKPPPAEAIGARYLAKNRYSVSFDQWELSK